jgi:hypothetical protein
MRPTKSSAQRSQPPPGSSRPLLVASSYPAPLLEPVYAPLYHIAPRGRDVETRRPSGTPHRTFPQVAPLRDGVPDPAPPQQPSTTRVAVAFVGNEVLWAFAGASGSTRKTGHRMASSTASSCVLSWRWPAVTTTESGRSFPSQERCTLLVNPPRLRPIASSGGWKIPFLRLDGLARDVRLRRAGGRGRWCCPRSPPTPARPPHRVRSARGPASDLRCRRASNVRNGRGRSATGRSEVAGYARACRS